jgi:chromosome segregation ATPase
MEDRDKMIAKLVHDNETLMGEIQGLQHALHRMQQEKEALEASAVVGQRLLDTVTEQSQLDRREREAAAAAARRDYEALMEQHEADKDFLNTVFRELEAQLAVTRAEREETQSRAERERRASQKRIRELEELLRERDRETAALRTSFDEKKEQVVKQCEQRIAGLRLEKDNARMDKSVLKKLERDVGELKALALGSRARDLAAAGYFGPEYGAMEHDGGSPHDRSPQRSPHERSPHRSLSPGR